MSEPASITSGIAERYAKAVFELVSETGSIAALEADIAALEAALGDSRDLVALISSPLITRERQRVAIAAIAEKMELSAIMANTLALKADKRRLFVLPETLRQLRAMIAEQKGEVTAEVTSAKALSPEQQTRLAESLKSSLGKDVKINTAVDDSLIGGLIVKLGSKMIDTSIRSKLDALQNSMKEVG